MLVARIINLMEIHHCVNLLDLLCASVSAVALVLFCLCLLLLKLSITTACPLYEILSFIQNPLSPLLYPSHNLKCIFFKESKLLFLTLKIPFWWELYSKLCSGVLKGATDYNKNLMMEKMVEKSHLAWTFAFFSLRHKKVLLYRITGVLCTYPPVLICNSCTHIKTVPSNITEAN